MLMIQCLILLFGYISTQSEGRLKTLNKLTLNLQKTKFVKFTSGSVNPSEVDVKFPHKVDSLGKNL